MNAAEAIRLQLMLAGFDAMLMEEEAASGRAVRPDDPVVRAFLFHQANLLRTSRSAVQQRLDLGRVLRDRLPRTWAVFLDGRTSERCVDAAAAEVEGLEGDDLAEFDGEAVALVQEATPTTITRQLGQLRDRLNPDAVMPRHKTATNRRWVSARAEGDGMGALTIRSTAVDIAAAYDRIRTNAVAAHGRDGECRTLGQLMVDEAVDAILTGTMRGPEEGGPSFPMERLGADDAPDRKVVDATVLVIIPADTASGAGDAPAQVAGMGSIDGEVARQVVRHTRTWTRVAVDPVDDTVLAIDTHERYIPAGLKKLMHLRSTTCAGDGCGLPAHRGDIDHITRYEHDGRTRHDNLQVLCRASHQMKDEGCFDVRMMPDGRVRWKDKWGGVRVVEPAVRVKSRIDSDDPPPF